MLRTRNDWVVVKGLRNMAWGMDQTARKYGCHTQEEPALKDTSPIA